MKAALMVLLWAVVGLGQQPQRAEGEALQRQYAREKEKALGERYATEVQSVATLVSDPVIAGYVDRLAQRLAANCTAPPAVVARVIVSDAMNAFALPGGFLFVNTGLIRRADSEAELAGVLAHLLVLLQAKDRTLSSGRGQAVHFASIPLIYLGTWSGYSYVTVPISALVPLGFADAYRAAVSAADEGAVRCLVEAGYDPEALLLSLEKLQDAHTTGRQPPSHFATHPPAAERIEKVREVIARFTQKPESVINTSEFNEARERVNRLYPAPPQRNVSPPSLRGPRSK